MNQRKDLLPLLLNGKHIHFVGIKGTGCTALVEILHNRGAFITGSDVSDSFYTDEILKKLNINVSSFDAKNITDDISLVIYSAAYKKNENPELVESQNKNIPLMLYSEALGQVSKSTFSCGIAGVHGKTTTTGLTGTLLKNLPLKSQVLAGSVISSFNQSCTMNNGFDFFVAETCEYQRHFMAFCPQKIILTSVESDHEDYYPTYESIRDAFVDYLLLLPKGGQVIYCADDKGAVETVLLAQQKRNDLILTPYGEKADGDYKISFGKIKDGLQFFRLGGFDKDFALKVPGLHMVRNATAAIALCASLLKKQNLNVVDFVDSIKESLLLFTGAKRRTEIIGQKNGVLVIDDYAHHPTAIKTTLAGIKSFYPEKRLVVDFMSHTYSRTQALLSDFASSFEVADLVILHKIYGSAREKYTGSVDGKVLYEKTCENHKNVFYFEEVLDALSFIKTELKDGDLFITLGAGDNWKLGKAYLDN